MPARAVLAPAVASLCIIAALLIGGCPADGDGGGGGGGTGGGGTGGGGGGGTGGAGNLAPVAIATADRILGDIPLTVSFSSFQSTDDDIIVARSWDFGDGATSAEGAPLHTYTTTGTFTVVLTVTDSDGASDTATLSIVVTEEPVAVAAVDRTVVDNAPATFQFDGSASFDPDGTIVSFLWNFGDGVISNEISPSHTYAESGDFVVTLEVRDNAGVTDVATLSIRVGVAAPEIAITTPPASVERIIVSQGAIVWAAAEIDTDPSLSTFVRTGLDRDVDPCEPQLVSFDTSSGEVVQEVTGPTDLLRDAALEPTTAANVALAGDDQRVRIIQRSSGIELITFLESSAVNAVTYSPNGQRIAYGLADGTLVIREASGALVATVVGAHAGAINGIDYSVTGARVATAGDDQAIRVFDAETGGLVQTLNGHTAAVTDVDFDPTSEGRLASSSADGTARVWDVVGASVISNFAGHMAPVNAVAFSPDGLTVLSGGDDDAARQWTRDSGVQLQAFGQHTADVIAVAFNPTGTLIATGSEDNTANVAVALGGGVTLDVQPCISPVNFVAFDPADGSLITGVLAGAAVQLNLENLTAADIPVDAPQPFQVPTSLPAQDYFLFVELDTDQTDPQRSYAAARVSVIDSAVNPTGNIAMNTPPVVMTTGGDETLEFSLVNTDDVQVIDLGAYQTGDRVSLALLALPGYEAFFDEDELVTSTVQGELDDVRLADGQFSIALMDEDGELIAAFDEASFFDPSTSVQLVRDITNLYLIVAEGNSVRVTIERNVGATIPSATVVLDYRGIPAVTVGDQDELIPAFSDGSDGVVALGVGGDNRARFFGGSINGSSGNIFPLDDSGGNYDLNAVKAALEARLIALLGGFGVTVVPVSAPGDLPAGQFHTIYFTTYPGDGDGMGTIANIVPNPGAVNLLDPRNSFASDIVLVNVTSLESVVNPRTIVGDDFVAVPPASDADVGTALANSAAHHVAQALGLRPGIPTGSLTDIMVETSLVAIPASPALGFQDGLVDGLPLLIIDGGGSQGPIQSGSLLTDILDPTNALP